MSSTWTLCVCLLPCLLNCSVSEAKDVLLQCRDHRGGDIVFVQWIRPDLESEGSVFFLRDNHTNRNYQHPYFYGRVKLRNPQMKDGDISVILKNFNIKDTGTYECYVRITGNRTELISSIDLIGIDPGCGARDILEEISDKRSRMKLDLLVTAFVVFGGGVVVVVGFIIYKRYRRLKNQIHQPPADEAADHEL